MAFKYSVTIDPRTNILSGGPDYENYDDGCSSLGELINKRLTEQGDQILMIDAPSGERVSSIQLRDRSIQVARSLQALGVQSGDSIGLFSLNRLEFAYVMFGSFMCGASVSPLNVSYSKDEIQHAVGLSRPKIIFSGPEYRNHMQPIQSANPFIKNIIFFGDEFDRLMKQFDSLSTVKFICEKQSIDDNVAFILCSSGTTGLPKGVQLTQKNVMVSVDQYAKRPVKFEREIVPIPITLSTLPWFHVFGSITLLASAINKDTLIVLPKFLPADFLNAIEKYKINTMWLVPPLVMFLATSPLVDNFDFSTLKVIKCSAAPLAESLIITVRRRLGISLVRQGYGMTEGTLVLASQTDELHSPGSVGEIRPGIQCRIVSETTGENLPAFKQGEILIKGTIVMKGYVNDQKATNETIDSDGWLHTGDIGYYTDQGELFIVDRLKELIKYNGNQVPPAEIEALLLQHPKIADAGVIGKPDEATGELPLAFVVKRHDEQLTEQEVVEFVAGHLSPAKRLHGGVIFIDALPKNPSGKILRRELRVYLNKLRSKL